eukprot:CAMPEP_0204028792 /NCGR_PEP_ID=MMETSP0360-20130528/53223_1 /ASSEMBLY_ACC=CAM_ASM_000342 /TAXON_ID=268821 /ORGANISM="Scrippsiella Hangoei, Strain SHTV-5" /LENGTH=60 /DNA_ID=CAMNT_0050972667 /DNA_START=5 /DNA_END=183 /DNA_ORIENTATION=-
MAMRRSLLALALALCAALGLLRSALAPAFAGSSAQPAIRGSRMPRAVTIYEVMVTNPSVG